MDETTTRDYVHAHLEAVKRGDMEAVTEDFVENLRPHIADFKTILPIPIAKAEVLTVEIGDAAAKVRVRLEGENGDELTMESQWREIDGRPRIFSGGPVEP